MFTYEYDEFVLEMKGERMDKAVLGLGVAGEAGEVADRIKKELGHGKPVDREAMAKELGDVLWYVSALAQEYGYSLDNIIHINVEKLCKRFPKGYSDAASAARADEVAK